MADTFKIFGSNIPKPVAYGGGGLIVIGGVYYYRKQRTAKAQQASVDQAGATSIDPATGYPYGSQEDAAALSAQSNYQLPGSSGLGFAGGGGSGSSTTPGSFTSNAQWAQYVEAYEINNMGADAPTVGNAIGKYLSGQALTNDMLGLVQSAIAIGGYPPVSGPNGNPPNFVTSSSTPTSPGGSTPPPTTNGNPPPTQNTITVPNTNGKSAGTAHNMLTQARLDPIADPNQKATDIVQYTRPAAGQKAYPHERVLIVARNKQGQTT